MKISLRDKVIMSVLPIMRSKMSKLGTIGTLKFWSEVPCLRMGLFLIRILGLVITKREAALQRFHK